MVTRNSVELIFPYLNVTGLTCDTSNLFYWPVLTWIIGVASKQLRLLHDRVGDSTTVVNSLSPQMSELVEDAIAF